jgi:hypothetical protein
MQVAPWLPRLAIHAFLAYSISLSHCFPSSCVCSSRSHISHANASCTSHMCGCMDVCGWDCRLKALDVVTMRELSARVNVIPVIAKADTTCKDELVRFKTKVLHHAIMMIIEINGEDCRSCPNCERRISSFISFRLTTTPSVRSTWSSMYDACPMIDMIDQFLLASHTVCRRRQHGFREEGERQDRACTSLPVGHGGR